MTIRYFLIKKDDSRLIDHDELDLAGKLIGTLSENMDGKKIFSWEWQMTRSSMRRLLELNWSIYNEQKQPIDPEDFWTMISGCLQWWKGPNAYS